MEVDIEKLKLAYDDRINRKIPNPGGVGHISDPWELEQQQQPRGTAVRVIIIDKVLSRESNSKLTTTLNFLICSKDIFG